MKLLGRTAHPEDIDQCIDLLRDRFLYSKEQLKQVRSLWLALLSRDIARASGVYDDVRPRQILAFGVAAPLRQARFDQILDERAAFIARSLLEEWAVGREPFLDEREYAAANASAGLNIIVLHDGISERLETGHLPNVLAKMSENFVTQYDGCRLRAIVHEAFGVPREIVIDFGLQFVDYAQPPELRFSDYPVDREPFITLSTREYAERHPGNLTLNALFLRFTPPRFSFNPLERRLLRFASDGESDSRIADLLGIAPRTLKRRWADIYVAMEALTGIPSGGSNGHRGVEARRHVLRYVRLHSEALHAYSSLKSSGLRP